MHVTHGIKAGTTGLFREQEGTSRRKRGRGRAGGCKYKQNSDIRVWKYYHKPTFLKTWTNNYKRCLEKGWPAQSICSEPALFPCGLCLRIYAVSGVLRRLSSQMHKHKFHGACQAEARTMLAGHLKQIGTIPPCSHPVYSMLVSLVIMPLHLVSPSSLCKPVHNLSSHCLPVEITAASARAT